MQTHKKEIKLRFFMMKILEEGNLRKDTLKNNNNYTKIEINQT